jgi:hypothetical protein
MAILFWMLLLLFVVVNWRNGKIAHEAAIRACRAACTQASVQLLDQTVAFKRFAWRKGTLKRIYSFDYSPDGRERFRGIVWMHGRLTEYIAFDAAGAPIEMPPS